MVATEGDEWKLFGPAASKSRDMCIHRGAYADMCLHLCVYVRVDVCADVCVHVCA